MTCLLLILNVFFAQLLDFPKRLRRSATLSMLINTLLSIGALTGAIVNLFELR